MSSEEITARLEYLRGELRAERISLGELIELEILAPYIDPGDVELLEAAGVPEFPDDAGPAPAWAWPAGKTFGELSPADKAAASRQAAGQLQAELERAAPAIAEILKDEA
jgi:hypothetical protein